MAATATRVEINGFGRLWCQSRRAALALVISDLKGKFDGFALRVPTLTSPSWTLSPWWTRQQAGGQKGILAYMEEPLVSSDVCGDDHSAIFDDLSIQALGDHLVKVLAWYDNE
jgi:glyceraldehyde 3-phosphate dehydrogenase